MELEKPRIFIFGWPGFLGGADTKLAHLLILLYEHCEITVIPNENRHLHNKTWTKGLDKLGVKYTLIEGYLPDSVVLLWRCPTSVSSLTASPTEPRRKA